MLLLILLLPLSLLFFGMQVNFCLMRIINWLYFWRKVNPKEEVNKEMSEKYGDNWLEKCIEALKDEEVRKGIRKTLNIGEYAS